MAKEMLSSFWALSGLLTGSKYIALH